MARAERRPRAERRARPSRCGAGATTLGAAGLLRLLWLASPALPIGGFSYSEGLEAAVDAGLVRDEAQAGAWLVAQLGLAFARSDLAAVAGAWPAWRRSDVEAVQALNAWVHATRETAELRLQSEQMGRSLAAWLQARAPEDARGPVLASLTPGPTWPVAAALAAVHSGAPRREALLAIAFGWAENLVQAAVRALPLGQSAGQRVLARVLDALPDAVDTAIARAPAARQAFAPMLAILSARHETQYSRLFRS
jgi:urease accessory protein